MPGHDRGRLSEREMYELKEEAAKYFANNAVPERFEEVLNSLFYEKPTDVYGRLSRHFERMSLPAKITKLEGLSVMDSTGNLALRCRLHCAVRNENVVLSCVDISTEPELALLPTPSSDSDEKPPTKETTVINCIKLIEAIFNEKLKGCCPMDQFKVDALLRKYIDVEEDKFKPPTLTDEEQQTPTPSSGKKKKLPSAKGKGKAPDKPIPPYEPLDFLLQGCSSVSCASLSVLKAASAFLKIPPSEHLHNICQKENSSSPITFPVPSITVLSGGKNFPGKLNIAKNVFIITKPELTMEKSVDMLVKVFHQIQKTLEVKTPTISISPAGGLLPTVEKVEQALDIIQDALSALELTAGQDIFIGIECAAHETFDYAKGKYEIMTGVLKSADEIIDFYKDIVTRYPSIIALIDPLRKEDRDQWSKLCEILSEKCFIVGSSTTYGSMHRLDDVSLGKPQCSGVSFCPGGRVTTSDLINAVSYIRGGNGVTIMTSPPGNTSDSILVDLAVGLKCDIVRYGCPARAENAILLDRLIDMERTMKRDTICYHGKFTFPFIAPKLIPPETDSTSSPPSSGTKTKK